MLRDGDRSPEVDPGGFLVVLAHPHKQTPARQTPDRVATLVNRLVVHREWTEPRLGSASIVIPLSRGYSVCVKTNVAELRRPPRAEPDAPCGIRIVTGGNRFTAVYLTFPIWPWPSYAAEPFEPFEPVEPVEQQYNVPPPRIQTAWA